MGSPEVGLKFDEDKIRFELIPAKAELELARVITYGAKKYGSRNWKLVDNYKERYLGACRRHLSAWMRGEILDEESGHYHLAHAICSLMIILEKELDGIPS